MAWYILLVIFEYLKISNFCTMNNIYDPFFQMWPPLQNNFFSVEAFFGAFNFHQTKYCRMVSLDLHNINLNFAM